MSTALWLLQRSVPPSVSAPMGSDDFNQALGVLIWLLTHFDGPQEQATVAEPDPKSSAGAQIQDPQALGASCQMANWCHEDEALANDTLQRRLAIDERAWREEEAQSRRAEADAVLLREKGLCLAQSARLGLSTSVDAAAGCTAVMGTEETLACPQPLLCATTEMRSLINDLHSSFSLFCTSPSIADDPLSVVSGQIRGGGAVSSSDVELALEAFGQHYLSLAGREALSKIWTAGQVCFADYAQTMLRLMAGFGPGSLALTENEALAALYVAFRLFDYSGSGVVGMADIELVLQALSCHLESHEVSELLGHLQQSGHDPSSELPFHCFLSLFMPTIRAGTELAGRADSEAAASETDRHQPSELVLLGGGGTHFAGGGAAGARAQRVAAGESIARSGTLVSHSLHCP
ncbi:hypothetical protein EMIHUDRAFT_204404 [Emiliania huxleyi CCMP1516]|uniref:EF-hand domain-containing protein n=2 Tax=Emiliania huxleyi TaxID=2903 RepID=A0A0D3JYC5_EMIH1|nr:hypothetical protein EMIHUDRAFT_204404 [Emiliania huxleyi CCMP1516]EOD28510.1 hypothetical protein EMIHUDRAFT_204404 [Emiliania huxleyi CCMP1516]|eukprot:XP_005780939.1 hypothetical protein EMIHUDRAFT_204404 [Emiliania huxleyi CCMP1516]